MVARVVAFSFSCAAIACSSPSLEADSVYAELSVAEDFDRFYLREYPRMVALAYALSGNRWAAEEIAQVWGTDAEAEAFLCALQELLETR